MWIFVKSLRQFEHVCIFMQRFKHKRYNHACLGMCFSQCLLTPHVCGTCGGSHVLCWSLVLPDKRCRALDWLRKEGIWKHIIGSPTSPKRMLWDPWFGLIALQALSVKDLKIPTQFARVIWFPHRDLQVPLACKLWASDLCPATLMNSWVDGVALCIFGRQDCPSVAWSV